MRRDLFRRLNPFADRIPISRRLAYGSVFGLMIGTGMAVQLVEKQYAAATRVSYFGAVSPGNVESPPIPFATPNFRDILDEAGIEFEYTNGVAGGHLMVEQTGGGAGWLDYDNDGHWDLYLVQGGDPAAHDRARQPRDQLYRNQADGAFREVARWAGVGDQGYGQGASVGDFDNDGFDDLYVTNVGPNVLYRNMGDGTFQDVTDHAGVGDSRWSTSAAWGDLDHDGDLDLYVCNYALYDPLHPQPCKDPYGNPTMCHPKLVDPAPDECFLNLGDGRFQAVADQRGLFGPENRALGVVIADLNNDGASDIYVANDTTENFLFLNDGNAWFTESAALLGCAVNELGMAQASMGVALGDFDHNGWWDLYLTHFTAEYNTLYYNQGPEGFQDVTYRLGLAIPTEQTLGFGTVMHDFNHDRREDIFIANGHIEDLRGAPNFDPRYDDFEMPAQLFTFDHESEAWRECSANGGSFFQKKWIGRGVAMGDYDNDGDSDLCVVHHNAPAALLRNDSSDGHWLKLRLIGRAGNRNGIGARVRVIQQEDTLHQELAGGMSYCSAHQNVLLFGLGGRNNPCRIEVGWPGGSIQVLENVAVDREVIVVEQL